MTIDRLCAAEIVPLADGWWHGPGRGHEAHLTMGQEADSRSASPDRRWAGFRRRQFHRTARRRATRTVPIRGRPRAHV